MSHHKIIIIGGGLSGLYAAYLLQQQGITDYLVLEAKAHLGGRIQSISSDTPQSVHEAFDLGATWFWEKQQPQLAQLIDDFNLPTFYQYEQGDMLIDRSSSREALRVTGLQSSPARRIKGGMHMMVQKIAGHISPANVLLEHQVTALKQDNKHVNLEITVSNQHTKTLTATQILVALPPRLALAQLQFDPPLPDDLTLHWKNTNTWMAAHAKYFAIYPTAFWRTQNLSGAVHGTVTPLFEIHDGSSEEGYAALFGFIGVAAKARQQLSENEICQLCRQQLVRLFGEPAAHPVQELIKDWTQDPFVATADDENVSLVHSGLPPSRPATGYWQDHLIGIASEFSPHYQGYLAGAIEASTLGVQDLIQNLSQNNA